MKLSCPHCGDSFTFDAAQSGRTFACTYCKRPLIMPKVEQLPPDDQQAYLAEVQKEKERAEKQRQKEEAARQAKARQVALDRKQAEDRRRQAALKRKEKEAATTAARQQAQERANWEARVRESQRPVPEESAVSNRFPALLTIAIVAKVVTIITVLFCVCVAALALVIPLFGIVIAPACVLLAAVSWVIGWSYGEFIQMSIDVANDIRATRLLTKHLAYHPDHHQTSPLLDELLPIDDND